MTENNTNPIRFDLIEILRIGIKWKKYIIGFAMLVAICTAIYMYMQKNVYNSAAVFYPVSALNNSRDNMFRTEWQDGIDAFGLENEVDRLITIGNSAPIISKLITDFNIAKHYNIDVEKDPKGNEKVYKRFAKSYKVSKGANNNLELNMKDEDDVLASKLANAALLAIQDNLRSFYTNSADGIASALEIQMKLQDSTINILTDSLAKMRTQFGIYNIMSPSRKLSDGNTHSTNAKGIELIQNLEELKDKYVVDRAKYESIRNEFKTTKIKSIPFLHVVQYPNSGGPKVAPFRTLTVLGATAAALFFALLFAVIVEYFFSVKHLLTQYNA